MQGGSKNSEEQKIIFQPKIGVDESEGVDKKMTKNDLTRRVYSQKCDASHTNSSMYFFLLLNLSFLVSHEPLRILLQVKRKKKASISLSVYLRKLYNICTNIL